MPAETKISKEKHRACATVTTENCKEIEKLSLKNCCIQLMDYNCALRYTCKQRCRCRLKHAIVLPIAMTSLLWQTCRNGVLLYITALAYSSQGHSLLFIFSFPFSVFYFYFQHLFSYCKVLSSEFLYCTAYAEVYVFIILCAASITVVFCFVSFFLA